jgi:hypothetical protein
LKRTFALLIRDTLRPEPMMIEKLMMKITTKSQIEIRLPDMKHNSEQKVEDNFRLPVF